MAIIIKDNLYSFKNLPNILTSLNMCNKRLEQTASVLGKKS